jgi:acetyl esterase
MLHPQARALLDFIEQRGVPPVHTLSPAEARSMYRERRFFTQPEAPQVALVQDLQAPGPHGAIPLRLYKPLVSATTAPGARLPVLVYFHGGGFVIGDLDTHDVLCRQLANLSGAAVVAVDYRMGPENGFPCAVDDCDAATRWVQANASALGLDSARLAVGGDSAGGNLAAVVALMARDRARDPVGAADLPIRFQLLIYPATDIHRQAESHSRNGQGYMLTTETMDYFMDHYIPNRAQYLDWRASPLLAQSHANLPPALVLTAGFDPLRDEGIAYAQKLSQGGNLAAHISFERQIHGFITMGRVIDEANAAVRLCAAELRHALA